MTTRALSTVYMMLVLSLLAWPLPHYLITKQIKSNPWKNFGLAMYSTLHTIEVSIRYRKSGRWHDLSSDESTRLNLAGHANEFRLRRYTRGTLAEPDDLADRVHVQTQSRRVQILVATAQLDGQAGIFDRSVNTYNYRWPPPSKN